VAQEIINSLKKTQTNQHQPEYNDEIPFPKLPTLKAEEMETLLKGLGINKAIAYDGVTDAFFSKKLLPKAKEILRDLWSCSFFPNKHFETRLVPLNKVHPNIPKSNQFRPIIIQSPNLKLLEARFQPKLTNYMRERLHLGQTGFVPEME